MNFKSKDEKPNLINTKTALDDIYISNKLNKRSIKDLKIFQNS